MRFQFVGVDQLASLIIIQCSEIPKLGENRPSIYDCGKVLDL